MAIIRSGHFDRICIHHSAVKPGAKNLTELKARVKSYDLAHSKKEWAQQIKTDGKFGYKYVEYHYAIAKDGTLLQLQDEKYTLYHASDNARGKDTFNLHGIAVMLDGNYQEEKPTDVQRKTLTDFIVRFKKKHKGSIYIKGHKETAMPEVPTSCPGKNIGTSKSGWLKDVLREVNNVINPPITPIPDPKPPVIPPPTELEVCLPESIYQKLLQKELDDSRAIEALKSLVSTKNVEIEERDQTILDLQKERDTRLEDLKSISDILSVKYNTLDTWDIQKYKYTSAIETIKNQSLEKAGIRQLIDAIVSKFTKK